MNIYDKLWSIKDSIKQDLTSLGDNLRFMLPVAFIVAQACFGDHHTSRVFCIALAVALAMMSLLKGLFNSPRPRETTDNQAPELDLDWSPDEGNSFVSGHTTSAMLGGLFFFEFGLIYGIIGVVLGALTGLSRVVSKAHWIRDVLGASVLSLIIYLICKVWIL